MAGMALLGSLQLAHHEYGKFRLLRRREWPTPRTDEEVYREIMAAMLAERAAEEAGAGGGGGSS